MRRRLPGEGRPCPLLLLLLPWKRRDSVVVCADLDPHSVWRRASCPMAERQWLISHRRIESTEKSVRAYEHQKSSSLNRAAAYLERGILVNCCCCPLGAGTAVLLFAHNSILTPSGCVRLARWQYRLLNLKAGSSR